MPGPADKLVASVTDQHPAVVDGLHGEPGFKDKPNKDWKHEGSSVKPGMGSSKVRPAPTSLDIMGRCKPA